MNLLSTARARPIYFINTTYLPHNVTLDWDPPVKVDQNGEIVGYINVTLSYTSVLNVVLQSKDNRYIWLCQLS